MFQAPAGYDEETISRALRAMPPQQHHNAPAESAHTQSQNPYPPSMQQQMSAIQPGQLPPGTNPQEMFLAALPWLQYMQQQQQGQPSSQPSHYAHQPPHSQPQHMSPYGQSSEQQHSFGRMGPPSHPASHQLSHSQQQIHHSFSAGHFGTLPPLQPRGSTMESMPPPRHPASAPASATSETSSPEASSPRDFGDSEAVAEDKRRRNTAASGKSHAP